MVTVPSVLRFNLKTLMHYKMQVAKNLQLLRITGAYSQVQIPEPKAKKKRAEYTYSKLFL